MCAIAAITVSFKRPRYIAKQKNRIDVCVTKTGKHDFPITILINEQNVTEGSSYLIALLSCLLIDV